MEIMRLVDASLMILILGWLLRTHRREGLATL
jgi:hypothetical protein